MSVEFGLSENDDNFSQICVMHAGTIAIASISDNRVTGSFSADGTCTNAAGTPTDFTVTNGSLNVPLISEGSVP